LDQDQNANEADQRSQSTSSSATTTSESNSSTSTYSYPYWVDSDPDPPSSYWDSQNSDDTTFHTPRSTFTDSSEYFTPPSTLTCPDIQPPRPSLRTFCELFEVSLAHRKLLLPGVRFWLTARSARRKPRTRSREILTQYVDKLRQAGIIESSKRGPFVSSIFVIVKKDNTARLIIDYSNITPFLVPPKFYLPSIYQLINRKTFPFKSPHNIKIDLKNAFFNIKIHEKSRYITTFWYAGKYWRFKYLPFGLSIAPFFMQILANYISLQFRQKGMFAWMHLDDLIVAHDDMVLLKVVLKDVL
jgi:hypothetical protein